MSTVTNFSLGKNHRLYVGNTASPTNDSAYTLVENENDLKMSWKADLESTSTKSAGKINIPGGDESYTIKATIDHVFTDPAYQILIGAKNQAYPYQIRDVSVSNSAKVIVEGAFTLSDFDLDMGEKGAKKTSITLENSGVVTLNLATGGRALTTS